MPAGRIIHATSKESTDALLETRKTIAFSNRNINWGGSWQKRQVETIIKHQGSAEQIDYFRQLTIKLGDDFKFRIEEPYMSIYAQDESALYKILISSPLKERVTEFYRPENPEAEKVLNQGEIIVKRNTEYEYKVVFREMYWGNVAEKNQIYDYLESLGDVVKLTKSCRSTLASKRSWFNSIYFYTKDPSILTFLNLISPGIVSGIYKLTKLD